DFAFVVERWFVFASQRWEIVRRFELCRARLFAGERPLVRRIMFVQIKRSGERFTKTFDGNVLRRVFALGTRAVAAVNRPVCVYEEDGEGKVVVELEKREVKRVGLHQPDADKLVHQTGHFGIATNQLFVKSAAVHSRDATDDDQQRLAGARGLGEASGQVVVNPVARGLDFLAVVQHALSALFGRVELCRRQQQRAKENGGELVHGRD